MRRLALAAVIAGAILTAQPAYAYRPFDGTDADVAKPGEFELELGPVHYLRQNRASYVLAPVTVLNLGLFHGAELVADSRNVVANEQVPNTPSFQVLSQDVFLKLVLVPGVLQGERGVSAALEAGPLLPGIHGDSGFGAHANLILSYAWPAITLHLNDTLNDTRQHDLEYFGSLIALGGPASWRVRPVGEIFVDHTFGDPTLFSGLAGVIWSAHEAIDVDAALRQAYVNDGTPQTEVRIGFTFRIDVWGSHKD